MTAAESAQIRIQVLSDLHLDQPTAYDDFGICPVAPHIALLGDIGQARDDALYHFLRRQLEKFQTVFFLLGNHEPFHTSWEFARTRMRDFETAIEKERQSGVLLGRFVFLDKTRVDLSSKVTILGCTLFSDILTEQKELVSMKLKDFDNIDDWAIEDHKAAYNADLAWLNDQVSQLATSEPHLQVTILTHYSPTLDPRSMDPRHTGSKIFSGFMTDLSNEICWNSPVVKTWIFGHTHFNCDFVDEGTRKRILANQRGYSRSPSKGFDPEKTVTLG